MSIEFLESHFDKVSYLQNLLIARATGSPANSGDYQMLRHQLLSDGEISSRLPSWLKLHRDLDSFWNFIKAKFSSYSERRAYISQQFTPLLDELEHGPTLTPSQQSTAAAFSKTSTTALQANSLTDFINTTSTPVARNKRNVFIVHGRDNEAKQEVARFIEILGLTPIILHEQASGGRTIIEKIEHYAGEADFALVLYTPCDKGRGAFETNVPARDRARQNVVFEHGYLMAKLGRENVCALVKGEIEKPNDISGVVYETLDQAGAWKQAIAKELRECGYQLKQWY